MVAMLLQVFNIALLGAFWPFFAGIVYQLVTAMAQFARMILLMPNNAAHGLRGRNLLRRFSFVKTTVINGELPTAVLSIDFDKAVAELNIAPRVILLRLNRRCEDRIDSND